MPKLKTHQATAKRFRFTGKKKIMERQAGQDHFNARESGRTTVRKRRDRRAHKSNLRAIRQAAPYKK